MNKLSLSAILVVFLSLTVSTLLLWDRHGVNAITGDEPHYLIVASGIVKHGALEQTVPYNDEFRTHAIDPKAPLGLLDEQQSTRQGPHGLFNIHNLGLPLLLALPLALGGVLGAKLFMAFCGALVIVCAWRFAGVLTGDERLRFWATFATCVGLPLIPASTQIYPELPAGLLSLVGLYWYLTTHRRRPLAVELAMVAAVAFLPWLQVKFAAASAILLIAAAIKIYAESKDYRRIAGIVAAAAVSAALLAAYNAYAFGKPSGPYEANALELSTTSVMTLLGLHFDQNQGFLLQNPIYLAGVFGLAGLYRFDRRFTLVWALVFLSLIVPNALHPVRYGGFSFSGRFGWAAAAVFFVPTLLGLIKLAAASRRAFFVLIGLTFALQLYFVVQLSIESAGLYNKLAGTSMSAYSIFYYPVDRWLPMLYDRAWAFSYLPNYTWLVAIVVLFAVGFLSQEQLRRRVGYVAVAVTALIFAGGLTENRQASATVFQASALPSIVGRVDGTARYAEPGADSPGFLDYGPYVPLRRGKYEVVVDYSSPATPAQTVGQFDVSDATAGKPLYQAPLPGTGGQVRQLRVVFGLGAWSAHQIEFRNNWNGLSGLKVYDIRLRPMPTRLSLAR